MLTKKILKSILNVKHTAIDNMNFCPMGRLLSWRTPLEVHNAVAASVEGRPPTTTEAVVDAHGAPAIGTATRSISSRMPLAYAAKNTASSRLRSHGRDMAHGSRGNSRHLPRGFP